MGRFRRRKRLKRLAFILVALLIGFAVAAESRFALSRVADIVQEPAGILPHRAVWGTITPEQERFWPAFWLARAEYISRIEDYYPVTARLSVRGWGKFHLAVRPLAPLYKVHWGGKFWYLSEEGRLWSSTLPENSLLREHAAEKKPVLSWSADRTTPINLAGAEGNVFESSLPLPLIKKWYTRVETYGWSANAKFIQAGVREGTPIIRLILRSADGGNGGEVLLPDDPEQWTEALLAVKKLYGEIANIPPDIFIDCTYKGKILIRNLSDNKKEEAAKREAVKKKSGR
ncbi:MAG: hypothetical protein Q4D58_09985 [Synergistaceae bacterium]|nr:hypothetical protein [Synergistaceae bacterium]